LFKGDPGAPRGVLQAAGHLLAIATGKSRMGLERALDHAGLRPFFQASRCADECHSKPHPQMLDELMAEFGMAGASTLMIGDTSHDLLMAQQRRGGQPCRDLWRAPPRPPARTPAPGLPA
jgi:phosphoglycolate phosphatase